MTLYARWMPLDYKIAYVLNGGANPANAPAGYTVESAAITLPAPARAGYAFGGWYISSGFDGSAVAVIPQGSTGDTTLYARWKELHRVTFEPNGGLPAISPCDVVKGDTVRRPADPHKRGYAFGGWYSRSSADSAPWDFSAGKITRDTTLHARWIPVTIRLDSVIVNGQIQQVAGNTVSYTVPCGDSSPEIAALLPSGDTLLRRDAAKPFRLDTVITATALGSLLAEPCTLLLEKPFKFADIVHVQLGGKLLTVIKNPANNGGYNIQEVTWYEQVEGAGRHIGANKFYYTSPSGEAISDSIFVNLKLAENRWITSCPYVPSSFVGHNAGLQAVVYPDPVPMGGVVHLKQSALIGEEVDTLEELEERYATFHLFDVQGKLVHEGKTADLEQGLTMPDVPGVYYLALEGKAGRMMVKIAVE